MFDNSFIQYNRNWQIYSVICPLIILGGLGFSVLYDLINIIVDRIKRLLKKCFIKKYRFSMAAPKRMQLQTKIVLSVSIGLIILGALAIFLSCLGLFGLSSYSVERRIKEIGIRKVLGASVSRIVKMLTKDFIKLVAIANLIAIPIAYFMMNAIIRFVYSYPVSLGAELFVITAGLTLIVAFLTVSALTIKSALANPADSLRFE